MARIKITAQYYENYDLSGSYRWKPKGTQTFVIELPDLDDGWMYVDDLKSMLGNLVAEHDTDHAIYRYLRHEVDFSTPMYIEYDMLAEEIAEETEKQLTSWKQ